MTCVVNWDGGSDDSMLSGSANLMQSEQGSTSVERPRYSCDMSTYTGKGNKIEEGKFQVKIT